MGIIGDIIGVMFIISAYRTMRKSRQDIVLDIENTETKTFVMKWLLHLFLLVIYILTGPLYPLVAVTLLVLQIVVGLWLLFDRKSYFASFEKVPEVVDKMFPLAYMVYFGINFLAFFFW